MFDKSQLRDQTTSECKLAARILINNSSAACRVKKVQISTALTRSFSNIAINSEEINSNKFDWKFTRIVQIVEVKNAVFVHLPAI
jgi:hypothetical protein